MPTASMRLPLAALRRVLRDESGQSLVVVVSTMTVLLGVSAFGIDAANWMAKHHQAQVVADSAALAAADCLAHPGAAASSIVVNGQTTTLPGCTSSTDTAHADQAAEAYAAANGLTIQDSDVHISGNNVTVNAKATTNGLFSTVDGISSTSQSAGAGASWTSSTAGCTTPGGANCDFLFAHNNNCTSSQNGISLTMSGTTTVQGQIQSNANLSG